MGVSANDAGAVQRCSIMMSKGGMIFINIKVILGSMRNGSNSLELNHELERLPSPA